MDNPQRAGKTLNNERVQEFFKDNNYACKWKFSADNLIITPENKLAFIDLNKVGKRFWGYDLGWVFWPAWFSFSLAEFKKTKIHFKYLEEFFRRVDKQKPKNTKIDVIYNGYLITLERIIGGLYDVVENISHAKKITKSKSKRKAFITFLNELLELTLDKVENYK